MKKYIFLSVFLLLFGVLPGKFTNAAGFDLNNDGVIDNRDVKVLTDALGVQTQAPFNQILDLNNDGVVNLDDLAEIRFYLENLNLYDKFYDLNLDGVVDGRDASVLESVLAGQTKTLVYMPFFDLNVDGVVDIHDLGDLRNYLQTSASTASSGFSIGTLIRTQYVINVRATPNGQILGTQFAGSRGTIVAGPVEAGGFVWWQVNYDVGVDGWSAERYIY